MGDPLARALVGRARAAARVDNSGVRASAHLEIIDSVGCMALGGSHPLVSRIASASTTWQEPGSFRPIGVPIGVGLEQAVLLDALACHVDEFDSIHPESALVLSAAVVAPALHVAAWRRRSGRDLVDAIVAGYDTLAELGLSLGGPSAYKRGLWPTSTLAPIGAAIAVGLLLDLDDDALTHAIGIAAAGIGGLISQDRFGEGHYLAGAHASVAGMRSALFAAEGAQASLTYLEGAAHTALGLDLAVMSDRSRRPGHAMRGSTPKTYPCARPLHSVADALRRASVSLADVTEVRVCLPAPLLRFVTADTVVVGAPEAAASAAFVFAAVREERASDPAFFRQATLPEQVPPVTLQALEDASSGPWESLVELVDRQGNVHLLTGHSPSVAARSDLIAKARANLLTAGRDKMAVEHLISKLLILEKVQDVGPLLDLLTTKRAHHR